MSALSPSSTNSIDLFYSYSHEDEKLRLQLEKHLSLLKRQGIITAWHDRNINAGQEWASAINQHLNMADIILLLVSADFLASDYCYSVEMRRAMERHNAGHSRVIPIILRPCDWTFAPFGNLQALPKDAKPVTLWADIDEAFTDIVSGVRLVCHELQNTSNRSRMVDKTDTKEFFELFEVFKPSGVPTITFVEPERFNLLKLALAQPGRGVVIEGPSGIGKSTALKKAIDQLQAYGQVAKPKMLSARKLEDVQNLASIQHWHKGVVSIDDFHRLDIGLKEFLIDYLKYLADTELEDKKLVIVGIPQTGKMLVDLSFDVATRIEICKLGKVKDSSILDMINKGEKALNIVFKRKSEIVRAASGSLNVAQLLCYHIAVEESIHRTQPKLEEIYSDVETAITRVMEQMSLKFGETIKIFSSLGGPKDRTAIELLTELAATDDGFLPLYPLRDARSELASGIDNFLSEGYMTTLYNKVPSSQNHLLLDELIPALIIDDPQMTFYLSKVPFNRLVKSTGKREDTKRNKVFISYSHKDAKWLQRLQVHLRPLERLGTIVAWDDTLIKPGSRWRDEIKEALESAKVAVLLVSADFLASDFIAENELPPLLSAAQEEGTVILPVIIRPTMFEETELGQFQAVNAPSRPLSSVTRAHQEEIFVRIVRAIEGALSS